MRTTTKPRQKRARYGIAGALLGSGATYGLMRPRKKVAGVPPKPQQIGFGRKALRFAKKTKIGRRALEGGYGRLNKLLGHPRVRKFIIDAI